MRLSFGIRWKRGGGWSVGAQPTYDLEGWEELTSTDRSIVFYPTGAAFVWNVLALVLPVLVVGSLLWTVDLPWKWGQRASPVERGERFGGDPEMNRQYEALFEELRSRMTAEEFSAWQLEQHQRAEARLVEDSRIRLVGLVLGFLFWAILFPVIVLLVWIALRFGLYDLLRFPFGRLAIRIVESRRLEIQRNGILRPDTFQGALDQLSHITISVQEEISRSPMRHHGWVWYVRLIPHGLSDAPLISFSVERVRFPPRNDSSPPGKTRRLAEQLQAMTGLPLI